MKLKETCVISKVNDEYVLVDSDNSDDRFNGLIKVNETTKDIIETFMIECEKEEAINRLLEIYDVSYELLEKDVDNVIEKLKSVNLIS